jgi:hypothetical protein
MSFSLKGIVFKIVLQQVFQQRQLQYFSLNQTYQQNGVWKNFDMIIVWSYCFVKTRSGRKDLIFCACQLIL